jgi:hypothetical protein
LQDASVDDKLAVEEHLVLRTTAPWLPAPNLLLLPAHLLACLQDASVDDKLAVEEHLVLHTTAPWLAASNMPACCLPFCLLACLPACRTHHWITSLQ